MAIRRDNLKLKKREGVWRIKFYLKPILSLIMFGGFTVIAVEETISGREISIFHAGAIAFLYITISTMKATWLRLWREKRIILNGISTEGEILDIKISGWQRYGLGPNFVKVKFKFTSYFGREVESSMDIHSTELGGLRKGAKVKVFYNKDNPRSAIIYNVSLYTGTVEDGGEAVGVPLPPKMDNLDKNKLVDELELQDVEINLDEEIKDKWTRIIVKIIVLAIPVLVVLVALGTVLFLIYDFFAIKWGWK